MFSMWNLSNPISAKNSQISIEVSRLNLSCGAGDPKNSADRLGLRSPNSHQRAAFMHVRQSPGHSRLAKESEESTASLDFAYAIVSSDQPAR